MKVLLINAEAFHVKHKAAIPLGLLSIATYLEKNGHTAVILDRALENTPAVKTLDAFKPDLVGVAAPAFKCFADAVRVSQEVKRRGIPVVWGGAVTSLMPGIVLDSGAAYFVVVGEGEITLLELIAALENNTPPGEVNGLAFRENGSTVFTCEREPADLAELPVIDFKFVDPLRYFVRNVACERMLHVYASKGCVCRCTYCYNPAYCGGLWRARPPAYYLEEIRCLVEQYGMDGVCFADDLLTPDSARLAAFCENIRASGLRFIWGGELRADCCTRENLQSMYDTGCRWLYFGIESGVPERQKLIGKCLNLDKAKQTLAWCREIGIVTSASFILNFPGLESDELRRTVAYMLSLGADLLIPSFYGPIPKSALYEQLVAQGLMRPPANYREWEKIKMMDLFGANYSAVPDRELRVVSAHFYLRNFFWKYEDGGQSRVYVKKAFGQVHEFLGRGGLRSLLLLARAAGEFAQVVFYATAFPAIRKRYGLK